jgi:hypothetical protein
VLLAIVMTAVVVALVVWVVPLATSGVRAEDAIPRAEMPRVTLYDEEGDAHLVRVVRTGGAEDAPPWMRLYDEEGKVHLVPAP